MLFTIRLENGKTIELDNLEGILAGRELEEVMLSSEYFEAIDIYGQKHTVNWSVVDGVSLNT